MKNLKPTLISLLFIGFIFFSCEKDSSAKTSNVNSDDDYKIYSLIINEKSISYIEQETIKYESRDTEDDFDILIEFNPNLDNTIIENYLSRNETSHNLENLFEIYDRETELIPSKTIQDIFANIIRSVEDWENFEDLYPISNKILKFSRIGFNESYDQAILFYEIDFKTGYGIGYGRGVVYFNKIHGNWKIIDRVETSGIQSY